jgi:predicted RND superfamily exporter protein
MALVEILLNGVLEGVIFSLAFAFAILLVSTNNLVITLMSFSAILGIVMTVFLSMVLAGWEVSILESVCLIIIVGMSIDYTVHLMHSYRYSTYIRSTTPCTSCTLTGMPQLPLESPRPRSPSQRWAYP